jgi:Helix-turn-helix domain of resolvase
MSEVKRPVGRPSLYDPAYCEQVIELGKLGKSVEQIAAYLGVGTKTIYNWRDENPDFLHALDISKDFEQAWWEDQAHAYMLETKDGPKLNASLWSRSMAARFPKKYREQTKTEITGADGAPLLSGIQVTFVKPDEADNSER